MINPAFYILILLLLPWDSYGDTSKLRERTREGLKKIRSYVPQSILEAAHQDIERGQLTSAIRKLRYHQRLNPRDPEGYFLEGEAFALGEKYKEAYVAYHKAYFLTGSPELREKMEDMKRLGGAGVAEDEGEEPQQDAAPVKEDSQPETKPVTPVSAPKRGSFLILSKLRTLDSLIRRYKARKGTYPSEFDLDSLMEGKVTTTSVDVSELGKLEIKDEGVISSVYGTVKDQESSLETFKKAIALEASGDLTSAINLLESDVGDLSRNELDFLVRMTQRAGDTDKSLEMRKKMAVRFPNHYSNIFVLANYYFRRGDHKRSLEYFEILSEGTSSYRLAAEEKVRFLKQGGSYRLQEVFQKQREALGTTRTP